LLDDISVIITNMSTPTEATAPTSSETKPVVANVDTTTEVAEKETATSPKKSKGEKGGKKDKSGKKDKKSKGEKGGKKDKHKKNKVLMTKALDLKRKMKIQMQMPMTNRPMRNMMKTMTTTKSRMMKVLVQMKR